MTHGVVILGFTPDGKVEVADLSTGRETGDPGVLRTLCETGSACPDPG